MIRRGTLDVPVIGVAKVGWTLEQLRAARGRASSGTAAASTRPRSRSSPRCCATSTATTTTPPPSPRCARRSAARARPLHYLAIPPSMFGPWSSSSASRGCAEGARGRRREALRARSRVGARAQRDAARRVPRGVGLPHRPLPRARRRCRTSCSSASPTRSSSRSGTATTSRACRSRWPRTSASRGAARFYEETGAIRDVVQNHLLQVVGVPRHGAAAAIDRRRDPRRAGEGASARSAPDARERGARPVPRLPRRSPASRRTRRSRPSPPCGSTSTPGAGRACRSSSAPASACPSRHRGAWWS